jgi:bacterioferritin
MRQLGVPLKKRRGRSLHAILVEPCSRPRSKGHTASDVDGAILSFMRKEANIKFVPLSNTSELNGRFKYKAGDQHEGFEMKTTTASNAAKSISRDQLVKLLNEDLSREYQAIISYVVYSQVLKGAEYMNIAGELEKHAAEELSHALIISNQIDYLGGMPAVTPKDVRTSEKARDMLKFDLENETETIRNYRERVNQCEELGEYAMAEHIREILVDEQDHLIALATALGEDPPVIKAHSGR